MFGFKTFAEKQIEQKGRAYDHDIRRERADADHKLRLAADKIERLERKLESHRVRILELTKAGR